MVVFCLLVVWIESAQRPGCDVGVFVHMRSWDHCLINRLQISSWVKPRIPSCRRTVKKVTIRERNIFLSVNSFNSLLRMVLLKLVLLLILFEFANRYELIESCNWDNRRVLIVLIRQRQLILHLLKVMVNELLHHVLVCHLSELVISVRFHPKVDVFPVDVVDVQILEILVLLLLCAYSFSSREELLQIFRFS